ncbi:RHS repeat domain-containing protein [Flavivirga abyssicola]|uniref:RHS repeat protein n=1 Tax=Flavivirga abyssicola TaxID=3063533 RepID=UPI0026E0E255|nr:RHS repeat domain-containing protein [Flavivirga sp. MEBiC07777]WVK14524.1 RHS repeat domain-containing protein [Flavivirga sp. MEBiC07777]
MSIRFLYLIFLFIISPTIAQELPEIITPTPEAATLGKYGNTPVSKYTGVPQISIPLYTIVEGDISVPITLNYHAGGFKVQEDATWVGLGWSLTPGGMISRDPRGGSDQLGNFGTPFGEWGQSNILPETFVSSSINSSYNLYGISRVFRGISHKSLSEIGSYFLGSGANPAIYNHFNFQADHFNYSFPGGSGEFYNKDNYNFVNKSLSLVKIEEGTTLDNAYFKITNTDGTIYKYGNRSFSNNLGGVEQSSTLSSGGNSTGYFPMNWFMTNITSKNGDKVDFFYENTTLNDITYSTVSTKVSKVYFPGQTSNSGSQPSGVASVESQSMTQKSVLSKIEFTQGFIKFIVNDNSNPREDIKGNGAKKLEAIEVYRYSNSGTSILHKKIEFEYSYFDANTSNPSYVPSLFFFDSQTNLKRLRLDRIKEYGNNLNASPKIHEFEYNSIQLPPKTSFSVDRYGYFNNTRNFTYLPKQTILDIPYAGADVEPNPNVVDACLLEKITYPTKGSTTFKYEPNEYAVDYVNKETSVTTSSEYSGGYNNSTYYQEANSFTLTEQKVAAIDILFLSRNSSFSSSDLYVSLTKNGGGYAGLWNFQSGSSSAPEDAYCEIQTEPGGNGSPLAEQNCSFQIFVTLPAGTYTIVTHNDIDDIQDRIDANSSNEPATWIQTAGNVLSIAKAKISYNYRDYNDRSEIGPGVRIAEIINKDYDGTTIERKLFNYTKVDNNDVTIPSGVLLHKPIYNYWIHEVRENYMPSAPGSPSFYSDFLKYYRTNTSKKSFSTSANGKMLGYSVVTETSVDSLNVANGKIVSEYYNYIDDSGLGGHSHGPQNFPSLSSPLNGLLQNEKIYKFYGGDFSIVESTNFDYKLYQSNTAWYGIPYPFILTQIGGNGGSGNYYHPLGNFTFPVCLYPEVSSFVDLNSSTKKVYDTGDENNPISITTNYIYDNTQLYSKSTVFSNNKTQSTYYYYPLSSSYLPIAATKPSWVVFPQQMIDKNMVGSPVTTAIAIDGTVISKSTTDYKLWHQNSPSTVEDDIVMPEKIKISKRSLPMEDRIVYQNYDTQGKPLEVSKKDGTPIVYIWGYNEQFPVARIENATYASAIATLTSNELTEVKNGTYNQNTMMTTLNKIRTGLPDAMVTTYTYDPLIGVTSVTDPKGYTMYYEYDDFNRLEFVKDADGNLLSENEYNYKQ